MLTEKIVEWNDEGQIVRVVERQLSPLEEVADVALRRLEAASCRPELHGLHHVGLVIDLSRIRPALDAAAELLVRQVLDKASASNLWQRTGWTGLRVRVVKGQ